MQNGKAYMHYRVKSDGLLVITEVDGISAMHDGPFMVVDVDNNGFSGTELAFPRTEQVREVFARRQVTVTFDFF